MDSEHIYLSRISLGGTDRPRILQYAEGSDLVREGLESNVYTAQTSEMGFPGVHHDVLDDGRLVAVHPYPYEVHILSPELEPVSSWEGEEGLADRPPRETRQGNNYTFSTMIEAGRDGLVYIRMQQKERDETSMILDVYRPDGTFVARIPTENFGVEWFRYFDVGEDHVLVCDENDPHPRLKWIDLSPFIEGGGH
jgi:hypothetical protein